MAKYIIDLHTHGKKFLETLMSYSIGYVATRNDRESNETLAYIYNECANQVFTVMYPDPKVFLQQLLTIPNMTYFEHITELKDPDLFYVFSGAMREFGYGIYSQVQFAIGISFELDYLLEAITDTYMVVCTSPTNKVGLPG